MCLRISLGENTSNGFDWLRPHTGNESRPEFHLSEARGARPGITRRVLPRSAISGTLMTGSRGCRMPPEQDMMA